MDSTQGATAEELPVVQLTLLEPIPAQISAERGLRVPSFRPWFRFYTRWRTDERVQSLPVEIRAAAINLLCLAGESARPGHIELEPGKPYPPARLAHALNVHPRVVRKVIDTLVKEGVFGLSIGEDGSLELGKWPLCQPPDMTASERMARYRAKLDNRNTNRNAIVTPTVTVTATETRDKSRILRDKRREAPLPTPPDPRLAAVAAAYENSIGLISGTVSDLLKELVDSHPGCQAKWFTEAFREAARARVKNLKYVDSVLVSIEEQGFETWKERKNHDGANRGHTQKGLPGNQPAGAFADIS